MKQQVEVLLVEGNPAEARCPTILVVDDDHDVVAVVRAALEVAGYAVLTALDAEALRLARERHPALVLLDLQMPGLDGREISRRLRADPGTADIPIILMSADYRVQAAADALPVNGYVAKPFMLDHLYAAIARWVPGVRG